MAATLPPAQHCAQEALTAGQGRGVCPKPHGELLHAGAPLRPWVVLSQVPTPPSLWLGLLMSAPEFSSQGCRLSLQCWRLRLPVSAGEAVGYPRFAPAFLSQPVSCDLLPSTDGCG